MALKLSFKGEITHNKMIQQRTGRHQEKRKYAENCLRQLTSSTVMTSRKQGSTVFVSAQL
jgi:hypothetical protein